MATWVRPSATVCTGALALIQPAVSDWLSIFKPPSARPSGTEASPAAASRAAACADCCAAMACAARPRLAMERCICAVAFCCCPAGLVRADAGMPLGSLPVCAADCCTAPLAANQAPLKACWAWALATVPPAASVRAIARAIGASRETGASRSVDFRLLPPRCCLFMGFRRS
ncbi:hypothetical protein D3C71_1540900 [compost metagenome]